MQRLFTSANWTRAGALVLALLIWINVAFRSTYRYSFMVPVRIQDMPVKMVPVEPVAAEVEVQAEATGRDLFVLMYSRPVFTVNGRKLDRGVNSIPLRVTDLDVPKGVNLIQAEIIEPKVIRIELDRLAEKKVAVADNITLIPREGWITVGQPVIQPAEVSITGPAALLKNVTAVQTDTLSLEGVSGSLRQSVPLSTGTAGVTCEPGEAVYSASVQRLTERRIKDIPVRVLRVPRNIEAVLDEPVISLTVVGGEEVVSGLTRDDLDVTIDYRKLEQNPEQKFAASIKVPANVRWVKAEPQRFGLKEKIITRSGTSRRR